MTISRPDTRPRKRSLRARVLRLAAFVLLLLPTYALMAYVVLPASYRISRRTIAPPPHPISYTAERIPADPINVAVTGSRLELVSAMKAAGWTLADRISVSSGLRDARSVLFDRAYPSAPVSTHYIDGRRQDLAFEQCAGQSPRRRHHVRFWRMPGTDQDRPVWIGAATFDRRVGFSRYTGEVMHHIDPNVDAERDKLIADLEATGRVSGVRTLPGAEIRSSSNGGGDSYRSDGRILAAILCER